MIKMIHSGWAYIVVLMLVIAVVSAITGLVSKREFKARDLRISLFTLIVSHIQLIIGLITYFVSAQFAFAKDNGMGAAMKEGEIRYFIMEHPLMMVLAVVLITIGFSRLKKKQTDKECFRTIAIYYGIALLFVFSRIPWAQWLG